MADLFLVPKDDAQQEARLVPDAQERERALDVHQSWIVEAPAGSGKTGLLIQRYLKLMADESVDDPAQVLAITFTVKATAEMRERILAQLESASKSTPLKSESDFDRDTRAYAQAVITRDQMLGWGLLENPNRLRIRTIDSVCGEIANSLPVLSGSGGRHTPVEDASSMYREAARRTLMQLGGADAELNAALRVILLHRDGSLKDCERLLMEMLPLRNQWGELVPLLGRNEMTDDSLDQTVLPQLQRALDQVVCAGLTEFADSIPLGFLQELCSLAVSMADIEPYEREISPVAVCARTIGLPSTDATDLEHWRALIHLLVTPSNGRWRKSLTRKHLGFEITPQQKNRLKALLEEVSHREDLLHSIEKVDRLPPAAYPAEHWRVAKALFRVLSRALVELQLIFSRSGECDFAEWGLQAYAALEHDGGVEDLNAALGVRLQHLLVDEMQDTSTGQYRLIELLTKHWDGHSQTVFLVGDPKQSIYLFRQARVERFVRTMQTERLGDLPLRRLQLTANFRSQRELVETFNDDFSVLFPDTVSAANPEEVPYVAAKAVRGYSQNGTQSAVWHTHLLIPCATSDETKAAKRRQRQSEARQIRAIIESWLLRPLPERRKEPWKIAVLVRSRNLLVDIVTEFKDESKSAIPFRAVEIEELGQKQEVLDLFALTRALLHPADRVAWLAILHAPWCGLGLADLHLLAGADDPDWAERCMEDAISERGDLLSEDSCERLTRVWFVMRAASHNRSGLTTAQWVERTWRSLGGDAYLRSSELANSRKYFQLVEEVERQSGALDLQLLKRRIDTLYADPSVSGWAIDLMTIHKSKGLEWDVVIVPGLEKKAPVPKEKLLSWIELDSTDTDTSQIMLAPIVGRGEGSRELNQWLKTIEKARDAAERKRLFYVACTRAKEELHLFASPQVTANGRVNRPYGSLLATAWPAAERHFATDAPIAGSTEPTIDMQSTPHGLTLDIAASEAPARAALLRRIPSGFNPLERFSVGRLLSYGEAPASHSAANFERPEGSFEARAFGNAVHSFIDILTQRLADGTDEAVLPREIVGWAPRIAAVLRGDGLPPAMIERLITRVKIALNNMLQDDEGRWILGRHEYASSEYALTAWTDTLSSVRLDRKFFGGAKPLEVGSDHLWIIDYKTATHGREPIETFLAKEREKYEEQMSVYARIMSNQVGSKRLRVGLYYPLLPKLLWWEPQTE